MRSHVDGILVGAIFAVLLGPCRSLAVETSGATVGSNTEKSPAPTKKTCSSEEIEMLITGIRQAQELSLQGDLRGVIRVTRRMSQALSSTCQQAVAEAQGQQGPSPCSADEMELILDVLDEAMAAVQQGDFEGSLRPLERLQAVSQRCQAAIAEAQQAPLRSRPARPFGAPASVEDHGNGTYVSPGLGYCDRSSCGAF
jgi:hypothetical protein